MADVSFRRVTKSFGQVTVIPELDLTIHSGEFTVLLGPSGCGKTTLLRMVAGLESPTSGAISIGARDVTDLRPSERHIAMVFQSYALYPHLTVADNLAFPLRVQGVAKVERRRQVERVSELLGLGKLLERKPRQLSGGQRQRVALGRAMVREPDVFLFDEPLSNLDASMREEMRSELIRFHEQQKKTVIYVTHDQVEAMTMAQRIVIMRDGVIQQIGDPKTIYREPANTFVARFIGSPGMNLLDAEATGSNLIVGGVPATVEGEVRLPADAGFVLGCRPEDI
uniref:ABC transporter ATP-binding protein n=1 Tax=Shinella sp. TaxID=1870904 RepID=UPI003F716697